MNEQHLREQLTQLAAELEQGALAPERRERIRALMVDIEAELATPGSDETLPDQLRDAASAFEAEHPGVAGVLNNIIVALSSMGV